MKNPHVDDNKVVWQDEYSGCYQPLEYSEQFELQWQFALERHDFYDYPGVSIDDAYIDDRIYEWTGKHPSGKQKFNHFAPGVRVLDHLLDVNLIKGKKCIDVGCGIGRWTKTMLKLGAESVLSVDVSESALKSVRRFNPNTQKVNIMEIPTEYPELAGNFDFATFWGVAMHTHDPLKAFMSASSVVKSGGAIYLMVYAPDGMHGTRLVLLQRKRFAKLNDIDSQLAYVEHVYQRKWDNEYSLLDNIKNLIMNITYRSKGSRAATLDMLEPFYNWVIPLEVIYGWMKKAGFTKVKLLNEKENRWRRCAYHVLGIKS